MRRLAFIALLGLLCFGKADAFWQSRGSNYNSSIASSGGASVAFDAKTVTTTYGSTSSITNSTLTVGSGSNRALIAAFVTSNNTPTVTCVWDAVGANQSLTGLKTQGQGVAAKGAVILLGLRNPTSGNKILTCTPGGAYSDQFLSAVSFTGVLQTNDGVAFPNKSGATSTGTAISNAVTSAVGNMTVDVVSSITPYTLSAPTQTVLYTNNVAGSIVNAGSSYGAGASTVTFAWTASNAAAVWTDAAVDIAHQ